MKQLLNGLTVGASLLILTACQSTNSQVNAPQFDDVNSSIRTADTTIAIEAESFVSQHLDQKRRWLVFNKNSRPHNYPDADSMHLKDASGGSYIEVLPDTRVNHNEPLVRQENFTNLAGSVAVLSYPTYFAQAGTYYVWARAFSSGSEDNGVHFGLNGIWPETAQRLQFCKGKYKWSWSSAQRTTDNHCGVPQTITLEVPSAGVHNVMVSMREDGFELDKIVLTTDKGYQPIAQGPEADNKTKPMLVQKHQLTAITDYKRIAFAVEDFNILGVSDIPYYKHRKKNALAINAVKTEYRNKFAYADFTVDKRDAGNSKITLVTLAEIDGESNYQVLLNGKLLASFTNPETEIDYQETYFEIPHVSLKKGDVITVGSEAVTNGKIPENGGTAFARGRWRALVLSRG